jgi:hypothetical protein
MNTPPIRVEAVLKTQVRQECTLKIKPLKMKKM